MRPAQDTGPAGGPEQGLGGSGPGPGGPQPGPGGPRPGPVGPEPSPGAPQPGPGGPHPGRRRFLALGAGLGLGTTAACTAHRRPPGRDRRAGRARPEAERDAPGTAHWRLGPPGPPDAITGYTDRVSVTPGEELGLHVSTTAGSFRVSAFRVGWYGGQEARRIWISSRIPGRTRAAPRVLPDTRTVRADWPPTLSVDTTGWPEGAYLLRLEADSGHQRYVPLVVRSTEAAGRTVLVHAPATWQAYNHWGGASLYTGASGAYATRSLAVSFDRPYDGNGAEKFLVYERALVVLAERLRIPLAYTTGVDVHRDPSVLAGAHTVVFLGHDEYWTPERRSYVTAVRDAGTNLVFLGANTCFRRVRLEDSGRQGDGRTVVCYKTAYRSDPCYPSRPAEVTTDYRLAPAASPESSLTGVLYDGYPVDAPYVVRAAGHWVYEGTGVRAGDGFAHLVGVEYDRVSPGFPTPAALEITAHSPVVCEGRAGHSDSAYYTAPGGAGVFATGTMRWVEGLLAGTGTLGHDHGMDARTRAFVTRTTENVLAAFARGPAVRHCPPPRPNVTDVYGAPS